MHELKPGFTQEEKQRKPVTSAELLKGCCVIYDESVHMPAVFALSVGYLAETAVLAGVNLQFESNDKHVRATFREMIQAAWEEFKRHVVVANEFGLRLATSPGSDKEDVVQVRFELTHETIPDPYMFWVIVGCLCEQSPCLVARVQEIPPREEEIDG